MSREGHQDISRWQADKRSHRIEAKSNICVPAGTPDISRNISYCGSYSEHVRVGLETKVLATRGLKEVETAVSLG